MCSCSAGPLRIYALFRGGVDTGWTFYTPFSTTYSTTYVVAAAMGIFISGFSSIMTGLNFIATIHTHARSGPDLVPAAAFSSGRMYATSLILVLATPVLAITLLMVAVERIFQVGIFDPALGGDPVLFQHMFWFYSHPAVYIMILPGMAVVSEIIPAFSRKPLFGYKAVAFSSIAIAVLGFLVWGHHMFVAGESGVFRHGVFVLELISWRFLPPSRYSTGPRPCIKARSPGTRRCYTRSGSSAVHHRRHDWTVSGGARPRCPRTDTYFVVAHFHYIMVGGTVMAFLGGVHYWWPKISGKMYPEGLAQAFAL